MIMSEITLDEMYGWDQEDFEVDYQPPQEAVISLDPETGYPNSRVGVRPSAHEIRSQKKTRTI